MNDGIDDYLIIGSYTVLKLINLNDPNIEINLKGHLKSIVAIESRESMCEMYFNIYYSYSSAFDSNLLKWCVCNDENNDE